MKHMLGNGVRCALLAVLWPVLWLQARYVYRVTPKLPEATGLRSGQSGQGPLCRILIAGDSGAAGVGVSTQDEALCGQLVQSLGHHYTIEWQLLAVNGLDSPGLAALISPLQARPYDVVVLSIGANDATRLCTPGKWVWWQKQLTGLIDQKFTPGLLVHTSVPPMHACAALPQPLRWFMGIWAREMNRLLAKLFGNRPHCTVLCHPDSTTSQGMSSDGIHPSASGYKVWAECLSDHIVAHQSAAIA
jgi:lysophospholipase L1-like esterase